MGRKTERGEGRPSLAPFCLRSGLIELPARLRHQRLEARLPGAVGQLSQQLPRLDDVAGLAQVLGAVPEDLRVGRLRRERRAEGVICQPQLALFPQVAGQGEARTVVSVASWYTAAFGAGFAREQVENTFITDSGFRNFPVRRNEEGLYWENRFQISNRIFLNAGLRADILRTLRADAAAQQLKQYVVGQAALHRSRLRLAALQRKLGLTGCSG